VASFLIPLVVRESSLFVPVEGNSRELEFCYNQLPEGDHFFSEERKNGPTGGGLAFSRWGEDSSSFLYIGEGGGRGER